MEKFRKEFVGRKVRMVNNAPHEDMPDYYPVIGTIGTIVEVWDELNECEDWGVRWPEGSVKEWGLADWTWEVGEENIELVEEEKPMTDEEVWEMLESKMTKNGFTKHRLWGEDVYAPEDVHDMVALAYRVGYMRAKKGKPFKYERKVNDND